MSAVERSVLPTAPAPLQFFRRSESHAESACGRYLIQWGDTPYGRYYNAWFTPAAEPRKHLYQGQSDDDAKARCRSHHERHNTAGEITP